MSSIRPGISIEDLAGLVCATLARHGVDVVLSGGAVVSIYSENAYQSHDLDFIPVGLSGKVADAMKELGFTRRDPRNWVHPRTRFSIEFPSGPIVAGGAQISKFATRRTKHGRLRLLAPTECVMDRLSKYFHWGDRQGLEQAVAVAKRQRVNLARVEKWARGEGPGRLEKYREFEERLAEGKRRSRRPTRRRKARKSRAGS